MEESQTDFCKVECYHRYAIVTFEKEIVLNLKRAQELRSIFKSFFGNKEFVLITNRKYPHKVAKEVYKKGQLKNMKGLAVVSKEESERNNAMLEQKLFDKSFVFFNNLKEAISWAENYFSD